MIVNRRGQAFIQGVFALAVLGVISTAFVSMIRSSQEELALFTTKQGHVKFQQDLLTSLGRSAVCSKILHASFDSTSPVNPITIDWPSQNSTTIAAGVNLPEYGLTIDSIGFAMSPLPVSQFKLASGADLYLIPIRVTSKSYPAGKSFGAIELGPLFFEINAGNVTNCYDGTETEHVAQTACEKMGGRFHTGRCDLPAKFADVQCDINYAIQSFTLKDPGSRGCISPRPSP